MSCVSVAPAGDETATRIKGLPFALLSTSDSDTSRAWFDALGENGTVIDPLQERPWGDSDGQVRDEYGITWLISFSPISEQPD